MKQRVISAIVAAVIVIPILIIGKIPFALAMGVLAALALHETIGLKESHKPYPTLMKVLGFLSLELVVFNRYNGGFLDFGVSNLAICLSALALLIPSVFYKNEEYTTKEAFYLFGSVVVLGTFFNALIVMCNTDILTTTGIVAGQWKILYLFLIASMTDTFAMIIGCLIGKHKLIPRVSPKKSIEGSVAGSLVGTAIASIYYYNVIGDIPNIFLLVGITLLLSILGQIGDLFFSKIKRENDIKDFSNIMPGHGGILDRLDSFTFIMFGYLAIISILNLL